MGLILVQGLTICLNFSEFSVSSYKFALTTQITTFNQSKRHNNIQVKRDFDEFRRKEYVMVFKYYQLFDFSLSPVKKEEQNFTQI